MNISFKALPRRRYEYTLPSGTPLGQEAAQMEKVREEIKEKEHNIDKEKPLKELKQALEAARPYLEGAKKQQTTVLNATKREYLDARMANRKLVHLMACSAQSPYQQDKHDAIWLFNRLPKSFEFNKYTAVYQIAPAFQNLDRKYDRQEIARAERLLKRLYKDQPELIQSEMRDLYGNGKIVDFTA